jgi:cyanate permease
MTDRFLSTTDRFQTGTAGIEVNYMHNAAAEHRYSSVVQHYLYLMAAFGPWAHGMAALL